MPNHHPAQVVVPFVQPTAAVQVEAPVSVSGVSSNSAATARTEGIAEVVEAVCHAIEVTSGEIHGGEGTVRIQLKPDVLDGAEVTLTARNQTLTVAFQAVTTEAQALLERNLSQLEQHLAGRIHNYQIAVSVRRTKDNERV
ncbi:MAG: flagellar hook-length control protein FliK [Victivallales bacterium]|nr:flagellar hook-length control protein FliK [Victivallales bacterium]